MSGLRVGPIGQVYYTIADGGAHRIVQDRLREMEVSVADFSGFDATGATDSSAAVAAAIAALPAGGGTVTIPRGTPRFNVTITKNGVTLKGPGIGRDRSWGSGANYVRPWTDASPCIQVGNGALTTGVTLQDLTLYGATTGAIGVYFAEGAFRCSMVNVSAYEFTTNNFKFKGGATLPCSLVWCYGVVSQSTIAGNEGVLIDGNVASYTSAINFIGAHLSVGGAGSHALAVDSCDSVFMTNSYIDASDLKGIIFRKTGSVNPRILASNFTIDSNANTDILLEVPSGVFSTPPIPSEWIRGVYTLDGKVKITGGATAGPFTGPDALLFTPLMRGPKIDGAMYFPAPQTDSTWYNDTSANIAPGGAGGSRTLDIQSVQTRIMSSGSNGTHLGANGTYVFSAESFAFVPLTDNTLNVGDSANRFKLGYITTLRPGTGAVQWTSGSGSPEGVLTAAIGSLYTRTDGGAGTTLYVKQSGTGNTGWVAK